MSSSSSTNDLRNRIIFTIAILAVYRFGTFVPLPGIDPEQLKIMMDGNQKGLLGMFNVFAGGAVSRMAIFALGIMPYISSAIIVQLLTGVSDYFKNLKDYGGGCHQKIGVSYIDHKLGTVISKRGQDKNGNHFEDWYLKNTKINKITFKSEKEIYPERLDNYRIFERKKIIKNNDIISNL